MSAETPTSDTSHTTTRVLESRFSQKHLTAILNILAQTYDPGVFTITKTGESVYDWSSSTVASHTVSEEPIYDVLFQGPSRVASFGLTPAERLHDAYWESLARYHALSPRERDDQLETLTQEVLQKHGLLQAQEALV